MQLSIIMSVYITFFEAHLIITGMFLFKADACPDADDLLKTEGMGLYCSGLILEVISSSVLNFSFDFW